MPPAAIVRLQTSEDRLPQILIDLQSSAHCVQPHRARPEQPGLRLSEEPGRKLMDINGNSVGFARFIETQPFTGNKCSGFPCHIKDIGQVPWCTRPRLNARRCFDCFDATSTRDGTRSRDRPSASECNDGNVPHYIEPGAKHAKLRFVVNGRIGMHPISKTPLRREPQHQVGIVPRQSGMGDGAIGTRALPPQTCLRVPAGRPARNP
jgi:hypothetical protein